MNKSELITEIENTREIIISLKRSLRAEKDHLKILEKQANVEQK